MQELTDSDGLNPSTIEEKAEETAKKASKIMETYLGFTSTSRFEPCMQ